MLTDDELAGRFLELSFAGHETVAKLIPNQGRWTTRDVAVRDTVIPAGQQVILVTGAAVHDERKYPDPDTFDIHRDIDRHVSFGIDETGVERNVSVNVRGLSKLPLVVGSRAAV
jgi:cytochrome P450